MSTDTPTTETVRDAADTHPSGGRYRPHGATPLHDGPLGGCDLPECREANLDAAIRSRLDDPIDIALNGWPYLDAIRVVLDQCARCERGGTFMSPAIIRNFIAAALGVSDAQ